MEDFKNKSLEQVAYSLALSQFSPEEQEIIRQDEEMKKYL